MKNKLRNDVDMIYKEALASVPSMWYTPGLPEGYVRMYEGDMDVYGYTPQQAYDAAIDKLMNNLYIISGYPGADKYTNRPLDVAKLDPLHRLEVILPNLAKDPAVVKAIQTGSATLADTVGHFASNKGDMKGFADKFLPPAGGGSGLPDIELDLYGLGDHETNFIIGLYIGAFARGPEHEGLDYWARQLADKLASGRDLNNSLLDIAKEFYAGGTANGEKGTNLSTAEFITQAYRNVLGREPDADGMAYWTSKLEHEGLLRADFLVPFVNGGLVNQGDSEHLLRKIDVAKVVAQEHVTGSSIDGTLLLAVGAVDSDAAAWEIVEHVNSFYGQPSGPFAMRSIEMFSNEQTLAYEELLGSLDHQVSADDYFDNYLIDPNATDVSLVGLDHSYSETPVFG